MVAKVSRTCSVCGDVFEQGKWHVLRKEREGKPITCRSCSLSVAGTAWRSARRDSDWEQRNPDLTPDKATRVEKVVRGNRNHTIYIFDCLGGCGAEIRVWKGKFKEATGYCRRCANRTKPFQQTFTALKASAKRRGIPVTLTYEQLLVFTTVNECHYCGQAIPRVAWSVKGKQSQGYFLDRKDNSKGYSKDNCVVCCTSCNYTRGDRFTYDEFLLLGPALRHIQESRKGGTELA